MNTRGCRAILLLVCAIVFAPQLIPVVLGGDSIVVQTTFPTQDLPPAVQEFASPSGTYRLSIKAEQFPEVTDESVPAQCRKAHYRLKREATVMWDRKLPFVMSDVIVTDRGHTVGVALNVDESEWKSTLILVIVDAAGDTVLCEKHEQAPNSGIASSFPPAPLLPDPLQIAVAPDLDRVEYWLHENSTGCGNKFGDDVFRVHALSTGDRKAIVYQSSINPQPKARRSLEDVRPVAAPDLLMLRFVHSTWPIEPGKFEFQGESLELVDARGLVIWQTYIDNPTIAWDPSVRATFGQKPKYQNCSRVTSTESGFVIENGATGKKDEYRISKGKAGWVVSEVKATTSKSSKP